MVTPDHTEPDVEPDLTKHTITLTQAPDGRGDTHRPCHLTLKDFMVKGFRDLSAIFPVSGTPSKAICP